MLGKINLDKISRHIILVCTYSKINFFTILHRYLIHFLYTASCESHEPPLVIIYYQRLDVISSRLSTRVTTRAMLCCITWEFFDPQVRYSNGCIEF